MSLAGGPAKTAKPVSKKQQSAIKRGLNANHTAFVENKGQWNRQAAFRAQSLGLDYWLRPDGVTLDYHKPARHNGKLMREGQVVKMTFVGSTGASTFVGQEKKAKTADYMSKGSGLMLHPNAYGQVRQNNVYPGVDFRSYYDKQNLRYDFIVAPQADASKIQLKFDGASSVKVQANDVEIGTQLGTFAHGKLLAYQWVNNKRTQVPAEFVDNKGTVGFKVGAYDHSKPLVLDPVVYGTYFGGDGGWDAVQSVTADSNGNVYMTGWTQATTFPVTVGPYFTSLKGSENGFVARLEGDAYNIDYSAFFGGSNIDFGQFITVDQFSNVWVAGVTTSPDFPHNTKTHTSATQPNMFIMRWQLSETSILDPVTTPAIQMIGFDGGSASTVAVNGFAIVPDPNPQSGDPVTLVIDGKTSKTVPEVDAVTTGAAFTNKKGFLLRYSYNGTAFAASAASQYVGDGLGVDMGGLAVDDQGDMFVAGDVGDGQNNFDTSTVPNTFVTTPGVFTNGRLLQKQDLFIRKYGPTGTIIYSCLIGGSSNETIGGNDFDQAGNPYVSGNCLAVDSLGDAYITGDCTSFDYPRTRGAYGETFNALQEVVVTKISPDASSIIYSTNIRSVSNDSSIIPSGIAIDQSLRAFLTGNIDVAGLSFPVDTSTPQTLEDPNGYTPGTIQTASDGSDAPVSTAYTPLSPFPNCDDFMNVLDPTGTELLYGTYLGGQLDDKVYGPYVDPFGDVWVYGWVDSFRAYADPPSGNTVENFGSLPAAMITPKAFKANGDQGSPSELDNVLWGILTINNQDPPLTWTIFESKDGWLTKFSIGEPIVSQVNLSPTTIPGGNGATSSLNVVLSSAAPVQGAAITIDLLTAGLQSTGSASFTPIASGITTETTVTIAGGATTLSAPITIFSNSVTTPTQVLVRAYYQGNFLIAPLSVVPWLQNFTVTPSAVVGGNSVTGTIVLATVAPAGGITVGLQSSAAGIINAPSTVAIAAGQQSAQFTATTDGVDLKSFPILTASFLSYGIAQSVEVDPASILNVSLNPTRVSGGTAITGTVTLNGLPGPNFNSILPRVSISGAPAGFSITSGSSTGETNVPLTFNSQTATFTIATPYETSTVTEAAVVQTTASASYNYISQSSSSNFTVDPSALFTFTLSSNSANPGATINGNLALSTTADSGGTLVTITDTAVNANGPTASVISYGSPVTIPAGSTGATFPIQVGATVVTSTTTETISATRAGSGLVISQTLTVQPSTISVSVTPATVLGGNPSTGTVTISAPAPTGGLVVSLTSSSSLVTVPSTVTILAGQTTASFNITTSATTVNTPVTITASAGGPNGISATTVINVDAPSLTSITFTPAQVVGLHVTECRLTLDGPAPVGGSAITLTSSNPTVTGWTTLSVTIPAGKSAYTFSIFVRRVTRPLTSSVSATDSSSDVVTATLTAIRY